MKNCYFNLKYTQLCLLLSLLRPRTKKGKGWKVITLLFRIEYFTNTNTSFVP